MGYLQSVFGSCMRMPKRQLEVDMLNGYQHTAHMFGCFEISFAAMED